MLALALKLLVALAAVVMPGGFLMMLGAAYWQRRRAKAPVELEPAQKARIPAGVLDQGFRRDCPNALCYRP